MQQSPSRQQQTSVIDFWRSSQADWFSQAPGFDRAFREAFTNLHFAAARRELDGWADTPEGTLALLILLDQFPRNAFRGTGHMYATDSLARYFARQALAAGMDTQVEPSLQLFFYLPFSHSEEPADQILSVDLNRRLGRPWIDHAKGHWSIIKRFGRFPHRNPLLGRQTTAEEQQFLKHGGFSG
ncbi:DUF924 family protein [Pseudomonas sp. CrR25]|nr:DUF924 family protein [Pseudomonas sp. CrR25]